METPPPLLRLKSNTVSDQGNQGTCFAHTATRLLSRLIKLRFTDYFKIQNESCSFLYNTRYTIYSCFIEEKENGNCKDNLDEDGWNKENISALLYRFIYNIITEKFGCDGGKTYDAILYVLDFLRNSELTLPYVKSILLIFTDETDDSYSLYSPYFDKLDNK